MGASHTCSSNPGGGSASAVASGIKRSLSSGSLSRGLGQADVLGCEAPRKSPSCPAVLGGPGGILSFGDGGGECTK